MAVRYLVDTNLLVYAIDRREPEKRERAREVLRRLGRQVARRYRRRYSPSSRAPA
jgi:predicted nucleic acid-binding protein